MLLHPDRLRNCSLGMRSPPVLRELASYFKQGGGGLEKLQAGLVFWDLISPPPTPQAGPMRLAVPLLQNVC